MPGVRLNTFSFQAGLSGGLAGSWATNLILEKEPIQSINQLQRPSINESIGRGVGLNIFSFQAGNWATNFILEKEPTNNQLINYKAYNQLIT
jgi:hypothetical protein